MSVRGHLCTCSVASPDFLSPFFHACWCSPLGVSGENTLLPAPTPLLCSCQLRDAQKMSVCLLPGHSWQISSSSRTCAAATGAGEGREVSWGELMNALILLSWELGAISAGIFWHSFFLLQRRATEGVSTLPRMLWSRWLLRFSAQHNKMGIPQPTMQIHLAKNCRLIFLGYRCLGQDHSACMEQGLCIFKGRILGSGQLLKSSVCCLCGTLWLKSFNRFQSYESEVSSEHLMENLP